MGGPPRRPQASKVRPIQAEGSISFTKDDTQTGMLLGIPRSARCVQRFDDSLNSAIHITFRAFAAFFIDAKAKRSVAESCNSTFCSVEQFKDMHRDRRGCERKERVERPGQGSSPPGGGDSTPGRLQMGGARRCAQVCVEERRGAHDTPPSRGSQHPKPLPPNHNYNDPSAGSPTETLLRLLLPLNDQVCPTSRQKPTVANQFPTIQRTH